MERLSSVLCSNLRSAILKNKTEMKLVKTTLVMIIRMMVAMVMTMLAMMMLAMMMLPMMMWTAWDNWRAQAQSLGGV